jgi:Ca2+-binding EF-hand superfamily protein
MKNLITMMEEFHRAFGHPIDKPELISDWEFARLRGNLIGEEELELVLQLFDDVQAGKISPNLLKEASDLLYVLLGTLVALGVADKLEEAFTRVHLSNMSKLDENGKPIYREDGKVLKGPNYKAPNLEDLI